MKPVRVGILQYAECVCEMNELAKYLPPPSMKDQEYDEADWAIYDKEFSDNDIWIANKYRLQKSMKDELEDKDKDYHSVPHK